MRVVLANESSFGGIAQIFEKAANFEDELVRLLSPYGCFVISEISDYIFDGRYFYDSDYHLNDLGVLLRTERLIDDLFAAVSEGNDG